MNLEFDIIPAEESLLAEYDCILIPALYCAKESLLHALDSYVRQGGNLIVTFKSAFSDEHLKIFADTQPHILNRTLGIHYDQFTYPKDVTVSYNGETSRASEWMELISCDTATPLAYYGHPVWNRYAAAAENTYGKGHTLYLASLFGENTLTELFARFFSVIGLHEPEKLPFAASYPVSVKQGVNDDGRHVMYFLNYSGKEQRVSNIAGAAQELLSQKEVRLNETITLAPWGVAILIYE